MPNVTVVGSQAVINNTAGSGTTQSYTGASSSNKLLLAFASRYEPTVPTNRVIGTIKYNNVAMTNFLTQTSPINDASNDWYYLLNPATGASNFVISYAGTVTSSAVILVEVANAKQTGQVDASSIGTWSAQTAAGGTVTTVADKSLVISIGASNNGGWSVAGAQTLVVVDSGGGFVPHGKQNAVTTPPGNVVGSFTGASDNGNIFMVSIAPAPDYSSFKSLLGVGNI